MTQVIRYDEALTFREFGRSYVTALTDYWGPNNHILHSLLLRTSTLVFGTDPWALRVPALLAGVALIVAAYWWISSAVNRPAGLVAAALVAGSSMTIEYSTTARGYMMQALAFVVLMELSRRILQQASLRRWAIWVLTAVAGFATSPSFAFAFAGVVAWQGLNVVFDRQSQTRSRMLWSMTIAIAGVALLSYLFYLPAIIVTGWDALVDNDYVQPVPPGLLPSASWDMVQRIGRHVLRDGVVAWLAPVFILAAILDNKRSFGRLLTPALVLLGMPPLLAILYVAPPLRVWLFLWPLYLCLTAVGLVLLLNLLPGRAQTPGLVSVGAIVLASAMAVSVVASGEVLRSREGGTFRDGPEAAEFFDKVLEPGDRIIVRSHPRVVLEYYLEKLGWDDTPVRGSIEEADRVYVVVYHPRPQDLQGVLSDVPTEDLTQPRLVDQLPETDIYLMERRPRPPSRPGRLLADAGPERCRRCPTAARTSPHPGW